MKAQVHMSKSSTNFDIPELPQRTSMIILQADQIQGDGIEDAKDLTTLPLDELVGNLKVSEIILENDGVVSKTTMKDKVKSLALKAKITREKASEDSDSKNGSDEDVDEERVIGSDAEINLVMVATLRVSVESRRRTRHLLEEHGAIVKRRRTPKRRNMSQVNQLSRGSI
nr:zf-CCHC domain-containing protein/UBN2 domain-containing protein [Tanacetum cinerariifolium]